MSDDTSNWRPDPCIDGAPHQFEPRYDSEGLRPSEDPDADWRPSYGSGSRAGGVFTKESKGKPKAGCRYLFDICTRCGRKIHNTSRRG